MKYVSLFSGIEAASVAWKPLGWECVAVSEIDKFPCEVLKHHFPNVPNLGSVTDITKEQLDDLKEKAGTIDLVVGGSPCQSFSVAGKRLGLEDARGNLMFEYCRIVGTIRPKWFIWENVPGALSSGKGQDFNCLLEEMAQFGYSLAWRVLDAQFFGVPQRRRRLFLVGCIGDDLGPFKVLFERESSDWDSPKSAEKGEDHSTETENCIGKHGDNGQDGQDGVAVYRKSKRAQSSEDYETWVETDVSNTINCFDVGDTRTTHAIIEPVIYTASAIRTGSSIEHTVCPTLRATHSKLGDNFPSIVVEHDLDGSIVTPLYARSLSSSSSDDFAPKLQPKMVIEKTWVYHSNHKSHPPKEHDKCPTLTAATGMGGGHTPMVIENHQIDESKDTNGVVYHSNHRSTPPQEHDKCPTLLAWMGTGGNNVPMTIDHHNGNSKVIMLQNSQPHAMATETDTCYTLTAAMGMGGGHVPMIVDQEYYENHPQDSRVKGPCEVAKSVTATYGTGGGNIPFILEQSAFKERDFGEYRECTVGGNLRASGGTLGGGSESLVVQYDLDKEKTGTLCARDGKGIGQDECVQQKIIVEQHHTIQHDMDFDLGGTLTARDHKGISSDDFPVNAQKLVLERHVPISIQGNLIGRSENAGPAGVGCSDTGVMYTLTSNDVHAVQVDEVAAPVAIRVESKVRRLTPIECERLQGFPDNWTQIAWRNKEPKDCPVSPRYKALGNSMAVPVMQWLGLGIMYAEGMDKPTDGLFQVKKK